MELTIGTKIEAIVTEILTYGFKLDYQGIGGTCNLLEITWDESLNSEKLLNLYQVGDTVTVIVNGVNQGHFYASIKAVTPKDNPWTTENAPQLNDVLEGWVLTVTEYGYFIGLPNKARALLLHEDSHSTLDQGTKTTVVVKSIDLTRHRIFLKSR